MNAQQFLSSLPVWDDTERFDSVRKDDFLAAEVTLPVPSGFTGCLMVVELRRPYRAQSELIVVDVSRLPVP
ncbi:hypothetical protein RCH06_001845 [Polaromonas sp. CG_9.5]|nr:hypothetical protein [Polaromonas sp. CG_9.5]